MNTRTLLLVGSIVGFMLWACAFAAGPGAYGLSDQEIDARLKIGSDKLLEGLWRSEELGGEIVILDSPFAGRPDKPSPVAKVYGFPVEEVSGRRNVWRTHGVYQHYSRGIVVFCEDQTGRDDVTDRNNDVSLGGEHERD